MHTSIALGSYIRSASGGETHYDYTDQPYVMGAGTQAWTAFAAAATCKSGNSAWLAAVQDVDQQLSDRLLNSSPQTRCSNLAYMLCTWVLYVTLYTWQAVLTAMEPT